MINLQKDQKGVAFAVAVLLVIVIAVTGAVALQTGEAYRLQKRTGRPVGSISLQHSSSQASCRVNGSSIQVNGSGSAYASCHSAAASDTSQVTHAEVYSSQGNGTATCTVNGQPVAC